MTGVSPAVVGFVRGLIEAAVLAAVVGLSNALGADLPTELAAYGAAGMALLRTVEGVLDAKIDPSRQRGVLGGVPAPAAPPEA